MKTRLFVLAGLAIGFALPTYAQQKDLADPQTTQKILAESKAALEAHDNLDAAAMAAGYTRDAVFLTPDKPIIGREAIQKYFSDWKKSERPYNSMAKFEGNAFHLIGNDGNTLWATGEFWETVPGKNGEPPIPVHSYNFWLLVRESEDWKILVDAWGLTPATVIGPNKSIAPQLAELAATPSPTASPSTQ
jgi:ketosteroid isomerase-like protein